MRRHGRRPLSVLVISWLGLSGPSGAGPSADKIVHRVETTHKQFVSLAMTEISVEASLVGTKDVKAQGSTWQTSKTDHHSSESGP